MHTRLLDPNRACVFRFGIVVTNLSPPIDSKDFSIRHPTSKEAMMNRRNFRFGGPGLAFGLSVIFLIVLTGVTYPTHAALNEGGRDADLIIGSDDDRQDNLGIQAGEGANPSQN